MTDKLKIISLCDGMSCGALALEPWLEQQGLTWDDIEYHAFEIDKYADAVSRYNYPLMYRHGDARNYKKFIGDDIFLLMGGFPCQPYSFSGKGKADDDSRDLSNLIFDALKELKPKYFLFENVPMKKEHQDRISDGIGVDPIMINSQDFSAHHRKRLYWTNIKIDGWHDLNEDVSLKDILEDGFVDRDKSHCLDANYFKGGSMKMYKEKSRRQLVFDTENKRGCRQVGIADIKGYDIIKRVYDPEYKAPALTTMQGGWRQPKVWDKCGAFRGRYKVDGVRQDHKMKVAGLTTQQLEVRTDNKTNSLTTVQKDNVLVDEEKLYWRNLTPLECERLQTVPDGYTEYGNFDDGKRIIDDVLVDHFVEDIRHISNTQRYKMLGNGWTVAVISHIMKNMEK
jgi:site-specific DNA-cytosine methylase